MPHSRLHSQPMSGRPLAVHDAAACPVCGRSTLARDVGGNVLGLCSSCGTGRLLDGANVPGYRGSGGHTSDDADVTDTYWAARRRMFERALATLERPSGPGRVLDIGGGAGHFSEIALSRGWDAVSMDSSPVAVRVAAGRLGPDRSIGPEVPWDLRGRSMLSHSGAVPTYRTRWSCCGRSSRSCARVGDAPRVHAEFHVPADVRTRLAAARPTARPTPRRSHRQLHSRLPSRCGDVRRPRSMHGSTTSVSRRHVSPRSVG